MRTNSARTLALLTGGLTLLATVVTLPVAAVPPPGVAASKEFVVDVASGPADMVTGGDALVRIDVPRNVPPHQVRVTVDGRDLSDQFRAAEDARTLFGLVSGWTWVRTSCRCGPTAGARGGRAPRSPW